MFLYQIRNSSLGKNSTNILRKFCFRRVYLPDHLSQHPFLQEFYGTVEWSVKGIFCHYMGWFSGKASELHPLERLEQSQEMVDLAGGNEKMVEKMNQAYEKEKFQWALQLAEALLDTNPGNVEAKTIKGTSQI